MTSSLEFHPLPPYLPHKARILLLGSFPPPEQRWSMPFFYPNYQNDMWRIMGLIFYRNAGHFEIRDERRFDETRIRAFCADIGIALYDTARTVRRTRNNASDAFLEIVEPTDINALLEQLPLCGTVAATGGKAAEAAAKSLGCACPAPGNSITFPFKERSCSFWRMPSTSRAYPMKLEKKAAAYRLLMDSAL